METNRWGLLHVGQKGIGGAVARAPFTSEIVGLILLYMLPTRVKRVSQLTLLKWFLLVLWFRHAG